MCVLRRSEGYLQAHGVIAVKKGLLRDRWTAARTIRSSQVFVIGGGTLIYDQDTAYSGIAAFCTYMTIAMFSAVPIVFYAQGIGPLRGALNRWLVRKLIDRVDLITVRDQASVDTLHDLAITRPPILWTADLAACRVRPRLNGPGPSCEPKTFPATHGPMVALCLKSWLGVEAEVGGVADALIAELSAHVVLVSMQTTGLYNDLAASRLVHGRVSRPDRVAVIAGTYTPQEIKGILGEMDMVLAMRLHASIFASAMTVPVLAISYSDKVPGFLTAIGQERWAIGLSDFAAGAVVEQARALWDARELSAGTRGGDGSVPGAVAGHGRPHPPCFQHVRTMTDRTSRAWVGSLGSGHLRASPPLQNLVISSPRLNQGSLFDDEGRAVCITAEIKGELTESMQSHSAACERATWTAAVINYNGGGLVADTIASLEELEDPPDEILLIDDGSSDDSIARVRGAIRAYGSSRWSVTQGGRPWSATARFARRAWLCVVDRQRRDVRPRCHGAAHGRHARSTRRRGLHAPGRLRRRSRYGLRSSPPLHFLCWGTSLKARTVAAARAVGPHRAVGCGIQLIDKRRAESAGSFDENLAFGWGDDGALHHRLHLAGWACYTVPDALVFHRRLRTTPRVYGQIHNRWLVLLTDFRLRTLLLTAPALLLFELMLVASALSLRAGGEYLRALRDIARKLGPIAPRATGYRRHAAFRIGMRFVPTISTCRAGRPHWASSLSC